MELDQTTTLSSLEANAKRFLAYADSFEAFIDWWVDAKLKDDPNDLKPALALNDLVQGYVSYYDESPSMGNKAVQVVLELFPLIKTLPSRKASEIISGYLHGAFSPVSADQPEYDKTIYEWYESKRREWENDHPKSSQK